MILHIKQLTRRAQEGAETPRKHHNLLTFQGEEVGKPGKGPEGIRTETSIHSVIDNERLANDLPRGRTVADTLKMHCRPFRREGASMGVASQRLGRMVGI